MKTLKDFSALQLTKTQMNKVTGGAIYSCHVEGEWVGNYRAPSKEAAEAEMKKLYGGGSCSKA